MVGIPFEKGDPRINREGRPVGTQNFTTKVRAALEKIADGKEYTYEEALIKSIMANAIVKGRPISQQLIWNYLDGKPKETVDHKNNGGSFKTVGELSAKLQNLMEKNEVQQPDDKGIKSDD